MGFNTADGLPWTSRKVSRELRRRCADQGRELPELLQAQTHVDAIFEIADSARDALTDSFITQVGRAFYEVKRAGE